MLSTTEIRQQVWQHIRENAKEKSIFINFINGYADHCHCLISLGTDQTMSKVMQLVKGESSFYINKHNLCSGKFEWQDEYYAVSVGFSALEQVREYIKNQEEHHKQTTFQNEFDAFISKYGFQKFG